MSSFDLGNLGALLGGMQQRMMDLKQRAAALRCTGEAGGGLVKVTMTGEHQVVDVSIAESAMTDRELLEDLVKAATTEAARQVRAQQEQALRELAGGLPLPPGLLPF